MGKIHSLDGLSIVTPERFHKGLVCHKVKIRHFNNPLPICAKNTNVRTKTEK